MMLSPQFLSQMAYAYQLSPEQEKVFLLRVSNQKDYEDIARELKTSAGACLKRMGQVYKKFGISGGTRGKESQLRHFLLQEYQRFDSVSTLTSESRVSGKAEDISVKSELKRVSQAIAAKENFRSTKVLIIAGSQSSEVNLAQQLQQVISSANYLVFLAEDNLRQQKNWFGCFQEELKQCDYLLLLLSPQSAFSDLLIEEVKLAKELRDSSPQTKPKIVVIRLNFPHNSPINYDLHAYLQGVIQQEWSSSADTTKIVRNILSLLTGSIKNIDFDELSSFSSTIESEDGKPFPVASPELPEGQVDLASPFYIQRPPIESRCTEMILQPGALIRIKAPRQMGKTSLMARILNQGFQCGYQTVHLNFQLADKGIFNSLEKFLKWFCANVGHSLQLPNQISDYWDDFLGSKVNCKAYFEQYLLKEIDQALVLGLDEVDRVFPYADIAEDFLGLLRAWYEEGKRRDIWRKLRLVVVHSTEVYIPMNINQSPFNVGLPINLPEFNQEQVIDLAQRYRLNWSNDLVEKLIGLVGGHPYLIRLALYYIARGEVNLEELLKGASTEAGIYSDHLRRHLWNLEQHPKLMTAIREVVTSENPVRLASQQAFKLDSMGLVKLQRNQVLPRCNLYRWYFQEVLDE